MAILPRYQKAGVQLQQMRELDQSGFREVANMGQTITEVVDRMSDFAYKKQAAKAAKTWRTGNYGSGGGARS
jgi:hypothetical protein